jgi:EAL domain-containing protein (putative c-di-GMP-specific phosphodiesterase class I)
LPRGWPGAPPAASSLPWHSLEAGAKDIAAGNYGQLIEATGLQEVDRVGEALNTMADTVAKRERQISRQAFEDSLTGLPNRAALLQPGTTRFSPAQHTGPAGSGAAESGERNPGLYNGRQPDSPRWPNGLSAVVASCCGRRAGVRPNRCWRRLAGGTFAIWFGTSRPPERSGVAGASLSTLPCIPPVYVQRPAGGLEPGGRVCRLRRVGHRATRADTLLRNAEIALHAAKRSAQTHAWYSEAQEAARVGHLGLVTDLRAAVADNQLQMWLQPKFSLATGQAIGAEALVRWQHPVRGFVSPAEFVPFAEQTGHITLVTQWMLQQALATLSSWATPYPHLSIAVNVSTRDLQDPGFAVRVKDMVCASGINPKRLRLEITESGLMDDTRRSIALLHALCDIGLPLSIDDFGTGYSSLAYLQQMPVTELKIDRSFIDKVDASPGTQRLVHAMVEMGHGLGLMVTAEGVETEAEKATITRLGCDVMQGYLGSRPLHGKALQDWLDHLPPPSPAPA